jgi:EAL and modified HD-GYP domain-containing signal transduction protein
MNSFPLRPGKFLQAARKASSSVIVDSAMLVDLQMLTGSAKAFINLDRSALRLGAARLVPSSRGIIEILEHIDPTAEVVELCKDLCASRHILALDD